MLSTLKSKWRFAVALAYFLAAAVVLILWVDASAACKGMPFTWPAGNRCLIVKFLYDWQQLLGGLFALGAAVIGWFAINGQVRQAEEQEKERWRRRYDAARAVLPLTLSKVHEYAFQCATSLQQVHMGRVRILSGSAPHWSPPVLPQTSMAELRAMIESSSPTQAEPITRLLFRIQIQAARLYTTAASLNQGGASTIVQCLVDTIEIAALTSALYSYARRLTDEPQMDEPNEGEMMSSMAEMGLDASLVAPVSGWIQSRYGPRSR